VKPKSRSPTLRLNAILIQALLLLAATGIVWFFTHNAVANLTRRGMSLGFAFLQRRAGFDIPFHVLDWAPSYTYGRALIVSFVNTLLVSFLSIIAATALGLAVGLMRLSSNWLVRNTAVAFIEIVRNTPILLQIVFWYVVVLQGLPAVRQSISIAGGMLLNIRGLYMPQPIAGSWTGLATCLLGASMLALPFLWSRRLGGHRIGLLMPFVTIGVAVWWVTTLDGFDAPRPRIFNIEGGMVLPPELLALTVGLSVYGSAFIAEIIRSGIEGVPRGQRDASNALGMTPLQAMFLVILPQALRMIVPPMTSQYLNIIKSSSLGAAIGYPEVFQIFAGTVLNQSGQAIEVMFLVMLIFLLVNLLASALMNIYNRRVLIVER
jgi:general L-amino acid transport system permease protein